MIDIVKHDTQLLLRYVGDYSDPRWVDEKLDGDGSVTLKRTFTFTSAHLVTDTDADELGEDVRYFVLACIIHDYHQQAQLFRSSVLKLACCAGKARVSGSYRVMFTPSTAPTA